VHASYNLLFIYVAIILVPVNDLLEVVAFSVLGF
jgi:hypothetical protein